MLLNKCELKITVYAKDDVSKLKLFFKIRQQNDSKFALIRYRINFQNYGTNRAMLTALFLTKRSLNTSSNILIFC